MKFNSLKRRNKKAFSLIEISIVIVVVSVLVTGALTVSVDKLNNARIVVTEKRIDDIYKALRIYLVDNDELPCPAPITTIKTNSTAYGDATGTAGACAETGTYISSADTNLVYGMVPVQDLDLPVETAEDGFGSKFSYIVDIRFTDDGQFKYDSNNTSLMTVEELTSTAAIQVNNTEAIFVIVSHGANKAGAFNANSSSQNARSSDTDEMNNDYVAAFNDTFIGSSARSDVFDDIVFYKSRNALVMDFDDLTLITCATADANQTIYGTAMTWPDAEYGEIVSANEDCPAGYTAAALKPTKRCGVFGNWSGIIIPCSQDGGGA